MGSQSATVLDTYLPDSTVRTYSVLTVVLGDTLRTQLVGQQDEVVAAEALVTRQRLQKTVKTVALVQRTRGQG